MFALPNGAIAQLARALAWHARGQGFDSPYLHQNEFDQAGNSTITGFSFSTTHRIKIRIAP